MFVYLNYAVVSWFEMPSKWHVLSRLYYMEPVLIVSEQMSWLRKDNQMKTIVHFGMGNDFNI